MGPCSELVSPTPPATSSSSRDRSKALASLSTQPGPQQEPPGSDSNQFPSLDQSVPAPGQQESGVSSPEAHQHPAFVAHIRQPSAAGLHLQTEFSSKRSSYDNAERRRQSRSSLDQTRHLLSSAPGRRRSSVASTRSLEHMSGAFSPTSSLSSPALTSVNDVTPLPSPIFRSNSPDLWRRVIGRRRGSSGSSLGGDQSGLLPPSAMTSVAPYSPKKKKAFPNLSPPSALTPHDRRSNHAPNRSLSEFVPDTLRNERPRNVTDPTQPGAKEHAETPSQDTGMQREECLAGQRRQNDSQDAAKSLPSPPPSNRSLTDSDEGEDVSKTLRKQLEVIGVHTGPDGGLEHWRPIRQLGKGAFSRVLLAVNDSVEPGRWDVSEQSVDPRCLVAIKIVSHGQEEASDEERIETGVRREIDVLQNVSHPCLPRLLASDDNESQAILVLNYCPGGDMFELASQQRQHLTPALIQRLFAELVGAVSYLHNQYIAHRDIKLENVLFNLPLRELPNLRDPQSHHHPLVTLTDLGLCKRIPRPPASPMLAFPCGSVDYAAPELLMQQPYDGRSTDMWALGVLLYAMVEGRLPFDPAPGQRRGGSPKHRIARCDWMWCEYGDEDGEWVESKGKGLEGAREIVEGLLKKAGRGRWDDKMVAAHKWVQDGIRVDGGLRR